MADAQHDATDQGGPPGGPVMGVEGAPSGGGDGGYGPEGDYIGAAATANADVLGQVNGNNDALIAAAQRLGHPRPDRIWIGHNAPEEGSPPEGTDR